MNIINKITNYNTLTFFRLLQIVNYFPNKFAQTKNKRINKRLNN